MRTILILMLFSVTLLGGKQVINLFKNGTSFITKELKVDAREGFYDLEQSSEAIFGTFFVDGKNLDSFASIMRSKDIKTPITTQKEYLELQIGSKIEVNLKKGEKFSGQLISIFDEWITIENEKGYHTIPISEIYNFSTSKKGVFEKISKVDENVLRLFFKTKEEQIFTIKYLTKGLTWIPNYIIEIKNDKSLVSKISPKKQIAKLRMEALVINDSENIESSELNFMIGAPNFKYNNIYSPINKTQTLDVFLSQLSGQNNSYHPQRSYRRESLSNAIMTQSMNNDHSDTEAIDSNSTFIGGNEENMYFYTLKNINLKKGERVMLNVIQQEVPFEHIYEATLPSNEIFRNRYSGDNGDKKGIEVWHSIKLSNLSNMPWTTGTVLVVKESGVPISQDMLYYTSAGKNSFLKLTIAPDIIVVQKDIEESVDQKKSTNKNGVWYDLVEIKGLLDIQNHKKESVSLSLKRMIFGNLKKSDKEWKFEKLFTDNYYGYWGLNSQNSVEWSITVDSKKTETINYNYSYYRQR